MKLLTAIVGVCAGCLTWVTGDAFGTPIGGIYALTNAGQRIPSVILKNPNIDGIALRFFWEELEPSDGVFDWSQVDDQVGEAKAEGKKVSLSIVAGIHTPQWVYREGSNSFHFAWDQPWGFALCNRKTIPLPWDLIFISKWTAFIHELCLRYDPNPALVFVKVTGINSIGEETLLPHAQNGRIIGPGISCARGDDVDEWRSAGYTPSKMLEAWNVIADSFAQAFPDKKIGSILVPQGFPPISDAGRVIPNEKGDAHLASQLIADGIQKYGDRFVVQNDGLSARWIWEQEAGISASTTTGYQMLWKVTGDPQCRMNGGIRPCSPRAVLLAAANRGINSGATFLEIYIADILNPRLQNVIELAHNRLQSREGGARATGFLRLGRSSTSCPAACRIFPPVGQVAPDHRFQRVDFRA